jgi:hypothetical protein
MLIVGLRRARNPNKTKKLTSLTFSSAARPSAITGTAKTGAGTASTANDATGAL